MVNLNILTGNSRSWTVFACLLLLYCYCVEVSSVVSKIPSKKAVWNKDRFQKSKVEITKLTTESSQTPTDDNLIKNESLNTEQKSLEESEGTTNVALTLTSNEETLPLEPDFTSTTVEGNKDATTLSSFSSTVSSIDSSSLPVTTVQSDLKTTTSSSAEVATTSDVDVSVPVPVPVPVEKIPCTCGIFLSSQFKKSSHAAPSGEAVISNSLSRTFSCDGVGQKHCQTKCLEQIVQHLPNSAKILCASLDRDIRKERAYLFIKNCSNKWINTNLAAGREYCCKNREPYNCK